MSQYNFAMFLQIPAEQAAQGLAQNATVAAKLFAGNPGILAGGLVLVIAGILILLFLKRVIVNSILGAVVWLLFEFAFGIKLPFLLTLIITIIFGLTGIGVMLILRFLGWI